MKTINLLCFLLLGQFTYAQTYTVVADSLRLPVGLEFDSQGRLWVVESGYGFNDGAVSIVQPNGNLLPVVVDLPAVFDTVSQENVGPWHTAQLPGNKIAVSIGTIGQVVSFDLAGFTPGVTPPLTLAKSISSLDIAGFAISHGFLESDPYTVAQDAAGNWYVADAAANAIIKVDASGQLSVFATFPVTPNPLPVGPPFYDAVPTRILAKPGGGFYVSQLTGFPFIEGAASVFSLDQNGAVTPFATGLTMLTDLVLDAQTGNLYALQLGKIDLSIFNIAPNSSRVIRIKPDATQTVVAENLDFASGLALDGQGNLYVAELASGRVLRLDAATIGAKEPAADLIEFTLAPNPATDQARVSFTLNQASSVTIQVLDAQGRVVFSQNLGAQEIGLHQFDWQIQNRPTGIYWVDIQTNMGTKTQRLLLK